MGENRWKREFFLFTGTCKTWYGVFTHLQSLSNYFLFKSWKYVHFSLSYISLKWEFWRFLVLFSRIFAISLNFYLFAGTCKTCYGVFIHLKYIYDYLNFKSWRLVHFWPSYVTLKGHCIKKVVLKLRFGPVLGPSGWEPKQGSPPNIFWKLLFGSFGITGAF